MPPSPAKRRKSGSPHAPPGSAGAGAAAVPPSPGRSAAATAVAAAAAGTASSAAAPAAAVGLVPGPDEPVLSRADAEKLQKMIVALKARHDAEFEREKLRIMAAACKDASTRPITFRGPAGADRRGGAAAAAAAANLRSSGKYARNDSLGQNEPPPLPDQVKRKTTSVNGDQAIVRTLPSVTLSRITQLPGYCAWIGLKRNFKVHEGDEDEVPRFIPYFGDSQSDIGEEAVRLFTNAKLRIKLPVNPVADRVYEDVVKAFKPTEEVLKMIGISFGLPSNYFSDRYPTADDDPDKSAAAAEAVPTAAGASGAGADGGGAANSFDAEEAIPRLFDSYKNLFCRRCYAYDCRDHGAGQPLPGTRDDTAMSIINTGTVFENATLVQSMTISKEDLLQASAGSGDKRAASPAAGAEKAAAGAEKRASHEPPMKRPAAALEPDAGASASGGVSGASGQDQVAAMLEQAECSSSCFRNWAAATNKSHDTSTTSTSTAEWSTIEEVSFRKAVQLFGRASPCRVARLLGKSRTCRQVWAKMEANPAIGENHAVQLSKAALLKRQQQQHIARRNAYYKRHKQMTKDEAAGANSLPALGDNALPEYVPCKHSGPCTIENGCGCAKKNMVSQRWQIHRHME
eukprot:SAG22_NODE_144_length_17700_cov_21.959207_12_plen_629_part_00